MTKDSTAMLINCGLVGPKFKSKGDNDGQSVNIPILVNGMRRNDGVVKGLLRDEIRS